MAANALQDRRGVGICKYIAALFILTALACIFSGKTLLALLLLALSIITGITWEFLTRPPINNPASFLKRFRELSPPRPVLVCLGDSLTHGRVSDDWTIKLPPLIASKMKFDPPKPAEFMDPVWVVNAGQNSITSWVILQERLQSALACYPDYVMVMIGTNDVLSICFPSVSKDKTNTFNLPEPPSMQGYKRNLTAIVDFLVKASPKTEVAVCTLPPLGEDLSNPENKVIKEANEVVHSVVEAFKDKAKISVLEVGERLQNEIISKKKGGKGSPRSHMLLLYMAIMAPLRAFFGASWNSMSRLSGGCVEHDGVHLNEAGGDVVAGIVVEWLFSRNVHKAIAVKQF